MTALQRTSAFGSQETTTTESPSATETKESLPNNEREPQVATTESPPYNEREPLVAEP